MIQPPGCTCVMTAVLYVANLLTCLWSDLADQGLTQYPKAVIDVLVFRGQWSSLISKTTSKTAIESVHPLRSVEKGISPIPEVTCLVRSLNMGL